MSRFSNPYIAQEQSHFVPFIPYGDAIDNNIMAGDIWEIGDPQQQMSNQVKTVPNPTQARRNSLINNNQPIYSTRSNTTVEQDIAPVQAIDPKTAVPFIAVANGRIESSELDRGAYFPFKVLDFAMLETIIKTPHAPLIKTGWAGQNTLPSDTAQVTIDQGMLSGLTALYIPILQVRIAAPVLQNVVAQPISLRLKVGSLNYASMMDFGPIVISIYDLNKPLELTFAAWRNVQMKPRYQIMGIDATNYVEVTATGLPEKAQLTAIVPGSTHAQVLGVLKAGGAL